MRAHDELTLPAVPPPAPATHPRRDLALVALFAFALVAIARFDPLDGHPRHVENRPMTPWPALIWSPQIFARFDAAFSDHFRGRNALIALQHELVVKGFSSSPGGNVILGRDDWLYFAGEDGHAIDRFVRTTLPVTDEAIARTVTELERRRAWLAARGIAYVVTVAPDKPTIYPEHLPGWIAPTRGPTPLDRMTSALRADPALRYVDLRPSLREAKTREPVYYRTDSHWNYLGAIVAYEALMREVQAALGPARMPAIAAPELPPYTPGVDTYRGDLGRLLGVARLYDEADVAPFAKILGDATRRCARRVDAAKDEGVETYECARAGKLRAVVYRDSMAIPLIPLLSENFGRVVYISGQKLDPALIERENPDVVIEEFVERGLYGPAASPMPHE